MRVLALLAASAFAASPVADKWQKIANFETHWNPYIRKYVGCPLTGEAGEFTCNPRLGIDDYKEFVASCHAAAKLFQLKDTCEDARQ